MYKIPKWFDKDIFKTIKYIMEHEHEMTKEQWKDIIKRTRNPIIMDAIVRSPFSPNDCIYDIVNYDKTEQYVYIDYLRRTNINRYVLNECFKRINSYAVEKCLLNDQETLSQETMEFILKEPQCSPSKMLIEHSLESVESNNIVEEFFDKYSNFMTETELCSIINNPAVSDSIKEMAFSLGGVYEYIEFIIPSLRNDFYLSLVETIFETNPKDDKMQTKINHASTVLRCLLLGSYGFSLESWQEKDLYNRLLKSINDKNTVSLLSTLASNCKDRHVCEMLKKHPNLSVSLSSYENINLPTEVLIKNINHLKEIMKNKSVPTHELKQTIYNIYDIVCTRSLPNNIFMEIINNEELKDLHVKAVLSKVSYIYLTDEELERFIYSEHSFNITQDYNLIPFNKLHETIYGTFAKGTYDLIKKINLSENNERRIRNFCDNILKKQHENHIVQKFTPFTTFNDETMCYDFDFSHFKNRDKQKLKREIAKLSNEEANFLREKLLNQLNKLENGISPFNENKYFYYKNINGLLTFDEIIEEKLNVSIDDISTSKDTDDNLSI